MVTRHRKAHNRQARRFWNGKISRAMVMPAASFVQNGRNIGSAFALLEEVEIVIISETGPLPGVTVFGEKLHSPPAGSPEQAKLMVCVNPFCGVIVSVTPVDCPD